MNPDQPQSKTGVLLVAMLGTPWLVLISSSLDLYQTNIEDLDYQARVLLPYIMVAMAIVGIGAITVALARRQIRVRPFVWTYLLTGPAFLVASFLRMLVGPGKLAHYAVGALALGTVGLALWCCRRYSLSQVATGFAMFSVAMILTDVAKHNRLIFEGPTSNRASAALATPESPRPNIYHILLDGYQSDVFASLLTDDLREDLAGFQYFPEFRASSGRTRVSIPTIFTSQYYAGEMPLIEHTDRAFAGSESMLIDLKAAGYTTSGYLHSRFSFKPDLFDSLSYYHRVDGGAASREAFHQVWFFKFMPRFIADWVLKEDFARELKHGAISPSSYPTTSKKIFDAFVAVEENRDPRNRYEFVHLILPHGPFVLTENCETEEEPDPLRQFGCANHLVWELVGELKRLGRFKDSLVLVQSDHGLDFFKKDGGWEQERTSKSAAQRSTVRWNEPRSRALLLIKPVGVGADTPFSSEPTPGSHIDIAATILHGVGVNFTRERAGMSLLNPTPDGVRRTLNYSYILGKDVEHIYHFVVENQGLRPVTSPQ